MKSKILKSALLVSLTLISLSCFVFVNLSSLDNALTVETKTISASQITPDENDESKSKMLDLALIKGAMTMIQKFLPAK